VTFTACGRGLWGNNVFVRVLESTRAKQAKPGDSIKAWVRVQVLYFSGDSPIDPQNIADPKEAGNDKSKIRPDAIEDFDDLSLSSTASNSLVTTINLGSLLVRVSATQSLAALPPSPFTALKDGAGGLPTAIADYEGELLAIGGDPNQLLGIGNGLAAMATVDGVSLLLIPDHVRDNLGDLAQKAITSCETLKDRFAILSTIRAFDKTKPELKFDTTFGALYHPWIWIYDPVTRDDQLVPPAGHVAGIIARTDIEQGVFKAPANAVVVGAKDLQAPLPKADQDLLNPIGVNCIRDFRSDRRGIRLWGARTMSSDPEWKYINVRRLFLYVEESIDEGTQWVVFEPNNEVTWGRVQRAISNFLMTIWRAGGLFGAKPEEAFFVRCDRTTMSEDDIQNGRLVCQIGICPVRPAEFVIFRIGQKTADASS
jgi:phage tail sheath protein FI